MAIRCENTMFMDLAGRERWLEQQAAQGFFPRKCTHPLWQMQRAAPRQLRYSLVPRGDGAGIAPPGGYAGAVSAGGLGVRVPDGGFLAVLVGGSGGRTGLQRR